MVSDITVEKMGPPRAGMEVMIISKRKYFLSSHLLFLLLCLNQSVWTGGVAIPPPAARKKELLFHKV